MFILEAIAEIMKALMEQWDGIEDVVIRAIELVESFIL